jgi:hypothetical protein
MGYAWIGCDIWIPNTSWPFGHSGWTFVLLLFSVASASQRKELPQDSYVGVSLWLIAEALFLSHCYLPTLISAVPIILSLHPQ